MDPDLFIRPDGRPILFLMSEANPERREVTWQIRWMLFTIGVIDFRPHVQILSSSLDKLTLYRKVKRLVEEGGGGVMADLPLETPQELLVTLSN